MYQQIILASEIDWQIPLTIGAVGYSVVLVALTFLFFTYSLIPKLIQGFTKWKLQREGKMDMTGGEDISMSGDEGAAIALALHLYFSEKHDEESGTITIKKVNKQYSPWSSKIHGISQLNR